MLQNDIRQGDHNNSFIPETDALQDDVTPSGTLSLSNYMQQSRKNFISYSVFLASYWDRLPQHLTQALGKK